MKTNYLILPALVFAIAGCAQQPMQVNVNQNSNQNAAPIDQPINQNSNAAPEKAADLKNKPQTFSCTNDADCTIVFANGCCPCNAGGTQIAINKKYENQWKASYNSNCDPRGICPQVAYRCAASASCKANKCQLD